MFDLSFLSTPMGAVLAVVAVLGASVAVMAVRAHLSSKRKTWGDVAQKCATLQLTHMAAIFQCLAVNDISGAIRAAEDLKANLLDDTKRKAMLLAAIKDIATDLYQDPAYRPDFNDFITKLQNSNMPDRASVFGSAVDELAHQKTLVQDMQTRLQTGLAKAQTDIAAFNQKVQADVSNFASNATDAAGKTAIAAAAATNPATAPLAVPLAVAAGMKTVVVPEDHTVTVTPPPAAPAPAPAPAPAAS